MVDGDKILEIVSDLVRDRFPNAEILDVKVIEDVDFDGDDVLRVQVIFAANDGKLDATATSGFLRHLRPQLSQIGVDAFPIMSFISGGDAGVAA